MARSWATARGSPGSTSSACSAAASAAKRSKGCAAPISSCSSADGTLSDRVDEAAERFGGIAPGRGHHRLHPRRFEPRDLPAEGGEWRIGRSSNQAGGEQAGHRRRRRRAAAPPRRSVPRRRDATSSSWPSKARPSRRQSRACRMPGAASAPRPRGLDLLRENDVDRAGARRRRSGGRRWRRCGPTGGRPGFLPASATGRSAMTGCCRRSSRNWNAKGFA